MVGLLAVRDIPSSVLWKKTLGLIQDSLASGNSMYVVPKFQGKKKSELFFLNFLWCFFLAVLSPFGDSSLDTFISPV